MAKNFEEFEEDDEMEFDRDLEDLELDDYD
jgi:hypothetical protein